jgi:uncharacterized LabA/DUF88 family protein
MKNKVCIYIDGANFYGGLTSINKKFTDTKFDFKKYINFLVSKDELIHINYYNALVKKKVNERVWNKQTNMFNRMRKIKKCRVTLCTRKSRLNILGEEYHTIKGDDLSLALDVIEDCYNNKFDKLILISGDGDFVDLINRIKRREKEVKICYFEGCASKSLLKKAETLKIINKKVLNKFFLRENKINMDDCKTNII